MGSQAEAEGLTLPVADNKAGYFGVYLNKPGKPKPYQARVKRGGKDVYLGQFATAEAAALCVARSPEGQAAAAKRAAAAAPLTSEEARQQAQAEGLTLRVAKNKAGYYGVHHQNPGQPKPYQAQVRRGGTLYFSVYHQNGPNKLRNVAHIYKRHYKPTARPIRAGKAEWSS